MCMMSNGFTMRQPEPREMSERKIGRERRSIKSEEVREMKSRVQTKNRFFHQSASAAKTSLQIQTCTPIKECKYLDMGKVGCYLILHLKMSCLGEHGPKNTTQSILHDLIHRIRFLFWFQYRCYSLKLLPSLWRHSLPWAHNIIFTSYHKCSSNNCHALPETSGSVRRKTFLLDMCCILLLVFYCFKNHFQVTDMYPTAIYFMRSNLNWKTKHKYKSN